MSLGLTSTMEFLGALETLMIDGGAIIKDGGITFKDITYIPEFIRCFNVFVDDAGPALAELQDLDKSETMQIVKKLIEMVETIAGSLVIEP